MAEAMSRFTVRYERDTRSGWWVAQVKEEPAAITQGRTLGEARRRIREALAVVLDDELAAEQAVLVDHVKLPAAVRRALGRARAARRRLDRETRAAQLTTALAVERLVRQEGLSVRDAGELLGISHQRVQQLVHRG
jgi:predicted RNase H-like HicB family nuclease